MGKKLRYFVENHHVLFVCHLEILWHIQTYEYQKTIVLTKNNTKFCQSPWL